MERKLGFRMKHNNDSIASAKAWKEHKAGYLKKEGGQKEYDMEKGEFYYSPKHKKLRLIPTDDGEVQDRSGIKDWQLAPERQSSQEEVYNMTPNATPQESKAVRDKFDTTYMKGRGKVTDTIRITKPTHFKLKENEYIDEDDFENQFDKIKGDSSTFPQFSVQDYSKLKKDKKGFYVAKLKD